jgi:hypothetical protein
MNITESVPVGPKLWEDIVAASAIGFLSLFTLLSYSLIVTVILRDWKTFSNNVLSLSMAFGDCVMLLLFLFYSVPCTMLQRRIFGDTFDLAMGVICNTVYFAGLACMSMIAINRYWAVCRFASYVQFYRTRNIVRIICLIWGFGIASGTFQVIIVFDRQQQFFKTILLPHVYRQLNIHII